MIGLWQPFEEHQCGLRFSIRYPFRFTRFDSREAGKTPADQRSKLEKSQCLQDRCRSKLTGMGLRSAGKTELSWCPTEWSESIKVQSEIYEN